MLGTFLDEIRNCMPAWCINSRCLKIPLVLARYGANVARRITRFLAEPSQSAWYWESSG